MHLSDCSETAHLANTAENQRVFLPIQRACTVPRSTGNKRTPDTSRTPTVFCDIAVGLTMGCSLPATANGHRANYNRNLSLKNSCICYCRVGFSRISRLSDPALWPGTEKQQSAQQVLRKRGKERSQGSRVPPSLRAAWSYTSLSQQNETAPTESSCSQEKGCRGFWGKSRASRKPGAAPTFPQTADSCGMRHLLKKHYTLLALFPQHLHLATTGARRG